MKNIEKIGKEEFVDLFIWGILLKTDKHYNEMLIEEKLEHLEVILWLIFKQSGWTYLGDAEEKIILKRFDDYCRITNEIRNKYMTKNRKIKNMSQLNFFLTNQLSNLSLNRVFRN